MLKGKVFGLRAFGLSPPGIHITLTPTPGETFLPSKATYGIFAEIWTINMFFFLKKSYSKFSLVGCCYYQVKTRSTVFRKGIKIRICRAQIRMREITSQMHGKCKPYLKFSKINFLRLPPCCAKLSFGSAKIVRNLLATSYLSNCVSRNECPFNIA